MRQSLIKKIAILGACAGMFAAPVAVSAENIAIVGGTAFTKGGAGKIENATILLSDGKIESVSAGGNVPDGYRVIDAEGKWVTSGLMVSNSNIGLTEVGFSGGINDAGVSKAKSTIALDALEGFNPNSTIIPITRIGGVTRAVTMLSSTSDAWRGQGGVIHLGDSDNIVSTRTFIGLNVAERGADQLGKSRASLWENVRAKLDGAKPKPDAKNDDDKDKDKKNSKPDPEKDALKRLFDGSAKLFVTANREADIKKVIALKKDYGIDVILNGAVEAWRVAVELAAADIPVVLNPLDNLPGSFESLGATQANAARLHAAGVKIAFVGRGTHNARLLPQYAGNAVANGLSWEAAMDAMTINPAEIFGISDAYGSLEKGKDGDIVVWSDDPIELMTAVEHVLVQGVEVPMVTRQTKLRDRYKELVAHPAYRK